MSRFVSANSNGKGGGMGNFAGAFKSSKKTLAGSYIKKKTKRLSKLSAVIEGSGNESDNSLKSVKEIVMDDIDELEAELNKLQKIEFKRPR
jgi:hypothetical protein